jgi:hypothetical protein
MNDYTMNDINNKNCLDLTCQFLFLLFLLFFVQNTSTLSTISTISTNSTKLGDTITHIDLSFNSLLGNFQFIFSSSFIYVNLSTSRLERLPSLIDNNLQMIDLSMNNLHDSLPNRISTSIKYLNLKNNPNLIGINNALPTWIQQINQYTIYDHSYECPVLVNDYNIELYLDPSYYAYNNCTCLSGYFGSPPNCYLLPNSQFVSTPSVPISMYLNDTFTDYWYNSTSEIFSYGMNTKFVIDETNLNSTFHTGIIYPNLSKTNQPLQLNNSNHLQDTVLSPTNSPSTNVHEIVMINITFYINTQIFLSTDIIDIYQGKNKIMLCSTIDVEINCRIIYLFIYFIFVGFFIR